MALAPRRAVNKSAPKIAYTVKINTFIRGIHYPAGATVDLTEKDAKYLLMSGTIAPESAQQPSPKPSSPAPAAPDSSSSGNR